jgi:hypothetical protein
MVVIPLNSHGGHTTQGEPGETMDRFDQLAINSECTDPIIGDILSGWRYDISGVSQSMSGDYIYHLEECAHCRSRQRLHRGIDVALIALTTLSSVGFLLALAILQIDVPLRYLPMHVHQLAFVLNLQLTAGIGLIVSMVAWLAVAVTTPVPNYLTGVALQQTRSLHHHLPEEVRARLLKMYL